MKKHEISALIARFATPVALVVLGLVLLFCPDTASALISKVVGWCLVIAGIVMAVAMVVDGSWSFMKIASVLVLVGLGRWPGLPGEDGSSACWCCSGASGTSPSPA